MKTITFDDLETYDGKAPAGYVEMDVRMGALQALDAQLRHHGLELEVADAGFGDFAKYVKVVYTVGKVWYGVGAVSVAVVRR